MSAKPNGTDAKDIALHFLTATGVEKSTPAIIGKSIVQAKSILKAGYTKDEIISVIDYIVERGTKMYSLGYVSHAINDVLREMKEKQTREQARQVVQEQEVHLTRNEVTRDDESTQRNQAKAERLGAKSGLRAKFDFDMFEK